MTNIRILKNGITLEIISALLILLFLYTGISKLYDVPNFERVLRGSPLIRNYATWVAWGIPILEVVTCFLLFFQKSRTYGLYLSLGLMTAFTLYIAYMLIFTPKLPCSCGGVISLMTWKQHLIFNIAYTLIAALGIFINKNLKANGGNNSQTTSAPAYS